MIELTEDQRQELKQDLPRVRDPKTNETYVLIRSDVYERLQAMWQDDVRQMQPILADLAPEDWEDVSSYEGRP
jgi:hypothetical protein